MSLVDALHVNILVIDVGGTSVKFGYALKGEPHSYERLFQTADLRAGDPVERLAFMIRTVIEETGITPDLVVSTVPGFVDSDEDRVLFAGNILSLNGRFLATDLMAQIGIPVVLERDSVLALIGETIAGAGRGARTALGIFFGTGVGAAFVEEGRPFRGAGWALEIGHMPFRGEGRQLEGMRKDALEGYVSGRALQMIADRQGVPIQTVFQARANNPELAQELEIFVRDQAYVIGTAIALFSPEVTILGGGLCEMAGFPKAELEQLVAANAPIAETGRPMALHWAGLGWRSALVGAPQAAAEHLKRHPISAQHIAQLADQPVH